MKMGVQYRTKGNYLCLECGHKMSDKNYVISRHVKNHGLNLYEYIEKNYKLIEGEFSCCGFCSKIASPDYDIDHNQKTYKISYNSGYFCETIECKKKISLDILGEEYSPEKFEKIGSRSEYLMRLYKIDILKAKGLKYREPQKKFKGSLEEYKKKYGEQEGELRYKKRIDGIIKNNPRNRFPCSLDNFIKRYGIEIGTKKYIDRCEKISYTSSKDFFIDKYGEIDGNIIWKNKFKQVRISKSSMKVGDILDDLGINYIKEKEVGGKFVDYYLVDYNMVIEFFGDYWHANPKLYESSEYNSRLKETSKDIWCRDQVRLNLIKNTINNTIIVVWESSELNDSLLEKTIRDFNNKNIIVYI